MRSLLSEFDAELMRRGVDIDYFLLPGASEPLVTAALAATGYPVPADLLALYTWHNGTAQYSPAEFAAYLATLEPANQQTLWPDQTQAPVNYPYRGTDFFPEIGAFMPLQDSADSYQQALQYEFWPANFWPIFHDDSLLINLNPASTTYGQIHLYSPSLLILEPEPYYDSLELMFSTFLKALKTELVPFGDELEPNFSLYNTLAGQMNPLSDYWRS